MAPRHLAFMVLINLVWGFALIAAKVSLVEFPPFLFTALRFTIVLAVLAPFLKILPGRMKEVIIIALCAGPLQFAFFFMGLRVSEASVVAIVGQLGVPFSTIMSIVFLKEEVHWRRWLGIALSFGGVMIMSFEPGAFRYIEGIVLVTIAAMIGSVGTIYQRQIKNVGVFELQAWIAVSAVPLMFAASFLFESDQWQHITAASTEGWVGLVYVACASSLIGHAGIYYLLQRYEVTQTAPLTLLAPIFTILFAVTLLGETMTPRMWLGGGVALLGVLIVSVRQRRIVDVGP